MQLCQTTIFNKQYNDNYKIMQLIKNHQNAVKMQIDISFQVPFLGAIRYLLLFEQHGKKINVYETNFTIRDGAKITKQTDKKKMYSNQKGSLKQN